MISVAFKNKGFIANDIFNLTPKEAKDLGNSGVLIVDVREEYMNRFKVVDVQNLAFYPLSELSAHWQQIPADEPVILLDAAGLRSKEAFIFLKEKGYDNIANMAGGIVEWERDGLPVVLDKSERLTGSCMCQLRKRERKK